MISSSLLLSLLITMRVCWSLLGWTLRLGGELGNHGHVNLLPFVTARDFRPLEESGVEGAA